jgi:hypothetical protein
MSFPFQQNDGGRSNSKRPKQKNDCVVRAFAVAFKQSYDCIYESLAKMGRKCSRGTMKGIWQTWIEERGQKISFPAEKGKKRMTPVEFCQKFPKGRFVVQVAGHLFAVIDGVVHDDGQPRADCCVYVAWQVIDSYVGNHNG